MSGNFGYDPFRSGAEAGRDAELILQGLLEAGGDALSKDPSSFRWAQLNADARAIAYLWSLNRRFANQWDAARMTDFLPRWERLFYFVVPKTATLNERRARVGLHFALWGMPPSRQVLDDLLFTLVPRIYVGIVETPPSAALGQVPGGGSVPGGVTLADGPWYSSVAHVDFQTIKPVDVSEYDYNAMVGSLFVYLDLIMPAQCTFDVFRDGPNGAGFFLDELNLDNERFD